jgi:hypothetical protein
MSTYQSYDFVKDINYNFSRQLPLNLNSKSEIFKQYLFKLKIFQLNNKITKDHQLFQEEYFIFVMFNKVYLAKKLSSESFDHIEILNGIRIIRKMKLKKLFN